MLKIKSIISTHTDESYVNKIIRLSPFISYYCIKVFKKISKNILLIIDFFIFLMNKYTSNHGQNFFLPIFWIVLLSIFNSFLIDNIEWFSSTFWYQANKITRNIIPFSVKLQEGMEFVDLLIYILISSLVWQAIVVIKRKIKR